jgi:hypothetical protein
MSRCDAWPVHTAWSRRAYSACPRTASKLVDIARQLLHWYYFRCAAEIALSYLAQSIDRIAIQSRHLDGSIPQPGTSRSSCPKFLYPRYSPLGLSADRLQACRHRAATVTLVLLPLRCRDCPETECAAQSIDRIAIQSRHLDGSIPQPGTSRSSCPRPGIAPRHSPLGLSADRLQACRHRAATVTLVLLPIESRSRVDISTGAFLSRARLGALAQSFFTRDSPGAFGPRRRGHVYHRADKDQARVSSHD